MKTKGRTFYPTHGVATEYHSSLRRCNLINKVMEQMYIGCLHKMVSPLAEKAPELHVADSSGSL